jgi:CBS domain containing-hemolysin-like protein
VAVGIITFLHVVVGEQAPKAWAITYAEQTSRWIAAPLMFFSWITRPVTNTLNWSANFVLRRLGIDASSAELEAAHSPEEIIMMLKRTAKSGHLDADDVEMIAGVFEFTEKTAHDVMTPRTSVVAIPADLTIADALAPIAEAGRSRYPVYEGTTDNVVGIVHVKDVLGALADRGGEPITAIARVPVFVPGSREVEDVLADMQRLKFQMAVVLDEYGGTAGILTMEDLLEEIVGEIYDEYDEGAQLPGKGAAEIVLPGEMAVEDVTKRFGLAIRETTCTTIGGYVFSRLGRLPKTGDTVGDADVQFQVVEMDGRRVAKVRMVRFERPHSTDNA